SVRGERPCLVHRDRGSRNHCHPRPKAEGPHMVRRPTFTCGVLRSLRALRMTAIGVMLSHLRRDALGFRRMLSLDPEELQGLLLSLPAERTPFIWGPPGIGKSAIVRDAAAALA